MISNSNITDLKSAVSWQISLGGCQHFPFEFSETFGKIEIEEHKIINKLFCENCVLFFLQLSATQSILTVITILKAFCCLSFEKGIKNGADHFDAKIKKERNKN